MFDFVGNHFLQVCSRDERQIIESGSSEGNRLKQELLSRSINKENLTGTGADSSSEVSLNEIAQAIAFKNRLIEYDRTSAQRTQVIDDASDYFDVNNKWLSQNQRTRLEKLKTKAEAKKNSNERKLTIDFAGRRILNENEDRETDR